MFTTSPKSFSTKGGENGVKETENETTMISHDNIMMMLIICKKYKLSSIEVKGSSKPWLPHQDGS